MILENIKEAVKLTLSQRRGIYALLFFLFVILIVIKIIIQSNNYSSDVPVRFVEPAKEDTTSLDNSIYDIYR